jgi:hypothetical protein
MHDKFLLHTIHFYLFSCEITNKNKKKEEIFFYIIYSLLTPEMTKEKKLLSVLWRRIHEMYCNYTQKNEMRLNKLERLEKLLDITSVCKYIVYKNQRCSNRTIFWNCNYCFFHQYIISVNRYSLVLQLNKYLLSDIGHIISCYVL